MDSWVYVILKNAKEPGLTDYSTVCWQSIKFMPLSTLNQQTDLSAGCRLDELLIDVLGFPVKVIQCGRRLKVFTCEPELNIFVAELRSQESTECCQMFWGKKIVHCSHQIRKFYNMISNKLLFLIHKNILKESSVSYVCPVAIFPVSGGVYGQSADWKQIFECSFSLNLTAQRLRYF